MNCTRRGFLHISLAASLSAIVAACTPEATPTSAPAAEKVGVDKVPPTPAPPEVKTVTFMSSGGEPDQLMFQEALEVASQQAAIQDNGIKIEWQPYPGGGWEKIMSMFAADQAYDVQRVDDDTVADLALNNKVYQLDCFMAEHGMKVDDYMPLFWRTINLGGWQFCMNPLCGAGAVYYNKALFEEAGVDTPPTSWADAWEWDEFVSICEKLSKKDDRGIPTQYAFSFPTTCAAEIAYGAGGSFMDETQTKCAMTEPEVVAAFDAFVELTAPGGPEYFVPPGLDGTELFNSGKLAMIRESMTLVPNISEDIDWEICPWPKTPRYAMIDNFDRTFVVAKTAPHAEAAFLVLKTLCEMPTVDVFAKHKFGIPYLIESAEGPVFNDDKPPFQKNVWLETLGDVNGHPVDLPTPRGIWGNLKTWFTNEQNFGAALSGEITTLEYLETGCRFCEEGVSAEGWQAGMMTERLIEAGTVDCPETKMWPETDWS